MNSPLLALFSRSLREDTRSKATYWARAGLSALLPLLLGLSAASSGWLGSPGRNFFITIITLQAVSITLVGLSYFASAIVEEKEEQTLGLLRMTNLNPLSILLGKSTSRLCGAMLILAAQLPFTAFAVTMGGVSLGQIAATYCALGAYIFLLCNVALFASVITRRTAGAAALTVLIMAFLFSLGPIFWAIDRVLSIPGLPGGTARFGAIATQCWNLTPIARIVEVLGTGFYGSMVGWQVVSNLLVGVLFFLLAWAAFGRFCDRAPEAAASAPSKRMRVLGLRLRRPARPGANALAWKDFHFLHGGKAGFAIRVIGYLVLPAGAAAWAYAQNSTTTSIFAYGFGLSWFRFAFWIDTAAMAARMFRTELNEQTLSSLATLPRTIRQIAYEKGRAFFIASLPGALFYVVGSLGQIVFFGAMSSTPQIIPTMIMQVAASWIVFVLVVHAVIWLSLLMKRGALPVGLLAGHIFNTIMTMVAYAAMSVLNLGMSTSGVSGSSLGMYVVLGPLLIVAVNLVVSAILHFRSLALLETLASEN